MTRGTSIRRFGGSALVAASCVFLSCERPPEVAPIAKRPNRTPLAPRAILATDIAQFRIGSMAMLDDCSIALAGQQWGTLTTVLPTGQHTPPLKIPGFPKGAHLSRSNGNSLLVFAAGAAYRWDRTENTLEQIALEHPWGTQVLGAASPMPRRGLDIIALFDRGQPTRPPSHAALLVPRALLTDRENQPVRTIGEVSWRTGTFLTWYENRAAVGAHQDTVVLLSYSSGQILAYPWGDSVPQRSVLPPYLERLEPREEVWTPAWIQVGGVQPYIIDVPSVAAATIGSNGRIYAVRNYRAKWRTASNPYVETQGAFDVTDRGLEVYDTRAQLLGAYDVPGDALTMSWSPTGLLLFRVASDTIWIVDDPFAESDACQHAYDGTIRAEITDVPPGV